MIVLDNSVLAKTILEEPQQGDARAFLIHAFKNEIEVVVPSLILHEFLATCLHHEIPFSFAWTYFEQQRAAGLDVVDLTQSEVMLAENIAKTGHKKSGFPGLFDSIYHAIAIERGGTFVTADQRHIAKTSDFAHVVHLSEWESLLKRS